MTGAIVRHGITGDDIDYSQVAADSFGNAIAYEIVGQLSQPQMAETSQRYAMKEGEARQEVSGRGANLTAQERLDMAYNSLDYGATRNKEMRIFADNAEFSQTGNDTPPVYANGVQELETEYVIGKRDADGPSRDWLFGATPDYTGQTISNSDGPSLSDKIYNLWNDDSKPLGLRIGETLTNVGHAIGDPIWAYLTQGNPGVADFKQRHTESIQQSLDALEGDNSFGAMKAREALYGGLAGQAFIPDTKGEALLLAAGPLAKAAEVAYQGLRLSRGAGIVTNGDTFYRVSSSGMRGEAPLSSLQQVRAKQYLGNFDLNNVAIRFVDDTNLNTGYLHGSLFQVLNIGSDVLPGNAGLGSLTANSRISLNGALAHEIVGHREAALAGRTLENLYLEEAQASIRAARFAPELTSTERYTLLRDGAIRLRNGGFRIRDVRDQLHINER